MSRESLDELCRHEPFVAGGYREYEVIPWAVHYALGIGGFDMKTIAAMAESEQAQPEGPS